MEGFTTMPKIVRKLDRCVEEYLALNGETRSFLDVGCGNVQDCRGYFTGEEPSSESADSSSDEGNGDDGEQELQTED